METLKRYRTGGEQKVTVHHVTVNDGGQAIVGTLEQKTGGRGDMENIAYPMESQPRAFCCAKTRKGWPVPE